MNDDMTFCGQHDQGFAIDGRTYSWPPGSHLTWSFNFTRLGSLTADDIRQAITAALTEISNACNVTHEYVENFNAANIKITLQRLDGASGVLADCQIPVGNVSVNKTDLLMRIDDSEAWGLFENPPPGKIDFYRVFLHEALHAHGLGHKPSNVNEPALIAPMYSRTIRNLQPADKAELVRRYGEPKTQTPTAPTQPPAAGTDKLIVEELRVSIGGKRYRLSGSVGPMQMVAED